MITGVRRVVSDRGVIVLCLILGAIALAGIFAPVVAPYDPAAIDLQDTLAAPSAQHPLGTDVLGRDVFSRVVWGARIALIVTAASVTLGLIIGAVPAIFGGYVGGVTDMTVSALHDLLYAFPLILLALYLMSSFGRTAGALIVAAGLGIAPIIGRVVRGDVLRVREEEYVKAAISMGGSRRFILWKHVVPNVAPALIVLTTTTAVYALLIEAALSFLGLSLPPPAPTWGSIVADGRPYLVGAPWISLAGGLAISATVIALNLLGDRFRDTLVPGGGGLQRE